MEYISDGIKSLSGYPADEFIRNKVRTFASIIHHEDQKLVEDSVGKNIRKKRPFSIEYRIIHANGSIRWVYEKGQGIFNKKGELQWLDGAIFDVTSQKQFEEKLRALSLEDDLTKLHNRRSFMILAEQAMKVAKRRKAVLSVLFIDLDNMKWINDTQGHQEGDKALVALAKILRRNFRESDVIARYGGDEFVILATGLTEANISKLQNRLNKKIDKYNEKKKHSYNLSVSIGISQCGPEQFLSIEKLIKKADNSMYVQKKKKLKVR
jgi:diguanylate cyclase (GGDEF)-like protein/PAS domain S-box-containing protein